MCAHSIRLRRWLCFGCARAAPILHLSTKVPLSGTKFSKHPKSPPAPPEKAQKPRESERRGAGRGRGAAGERAPTYSGRASRLHWTP